MHFRSHLIVVFIASAASARAQTLPPAPPGAASGGSAGHAVRMEPMVVNEQLDRAQEDIVPSLGAVNYQISNQQILAESLGPSEGFNQVLLRAPGVAQDSYGQVHIRGEHGDLQYRINDVLLPEGITGFGQELDPAFVKNVEVLTGSLPAQYGYRTAGVVDIHTESGASLPKGGSFTVTSGSYDTGRIDAEASGHGGGRSGFVTAQALTDDIGIESPTPSATPLHDRTRQLKLFGDFTAVIDPTSRLDVMLSGSFATFQIPDNPGRAPAFALLGAPSFDSAGLDENQREDNAYLIAAYGRTAGRASFQVSAFTRYSLVKFLPDPAGDLVFNGVASRVHQDLVANGVEEDTRWSLPGNHTLRAGFLATAENASTRTADLVFPTDAAGDQTGSVPLAIADDSHKLGWLTGAYAQDEWNPTGALTINYGVRADQSAAYLRENQVSPRVNAVWRFGAAASLHAGYARYFTPPPLERVQPADLARFRGTTNQPEVAEDSPVHSERADYYDAGISERVSPDFSLTLDGYRKQATNQLDEGQFGAALIFAPFNYARGRITGVELSANYDHDGFSAYANLAHSRAEGRDIVSGQYQFGADELATIADHWVRLDHDQELSISAGGSYRWSHTMAYVDFLYGSGLRSGFANTDHVPEHHPLNAGIEHDFKRGGRRELRLRLDVVNVFDETYVLRGGTGIGVFAPQYGQRRGFYGSVGVVF